MWGVITNALAARRDDKELDRLHRLIWAITETLNAHVAEGDAAYVARVGVRIRKVLEADQLDLDVEAEERRIISMPVNDLEQLANSLNGLASEVPKDAPIESAVALQLLAGWTRSILIRRRSLNASIGAKARELQELYAFHVKRTIQFLRGETTEI
jgi:hypothetical protein